jgi:membrane protease YdiL (CAAX protease family)
VVVFNKPNKELIFLTSSYLIYCIIRWIDIHFNPSSPDYIQLFYSKAFGCIAIFLYLWLFKINLSAIGYKKTRRNFEIPIASLVGIIFVIISFLMEYYLLKAVGLEPIWKVTSIELSSIYVLLFCILNAFMEEGLFRGIYFNFLAEKMRSLQNAMILQSCLFAFVHLFFLLNAFIYNNQFEISLYIYLTFCAFIFVQTFIFAMVLSYSRAYFRSIWFCTFFHIFHNFIQYLIFLDIDSITFKISLQFEMFKQISWLVWTAILFFIMYALFQKKTKGKTEQEIRQLILNDIGTTACS